MKISMRLEIIIMLIYIFMGSVANAATNQLRDSYCGINCIYTIMKLYGINIEYEKLLRPEYIDSDRGSSISGLSKAAKDAGMRLTVFHNLTTNDLINSGGNVILYTKQDIKMNNYNHYLIYIGDQDGKALILDPPNNPKLIPYYQLGAWWGGIGLVIEPYSMQKAENIINSSRRHMLLLISIVIAASIIFMLIYKYILIKGPALRIQSYCIYSLYESFILLAIAICIGWQFHSREGILAFPYFTKYYQNMKYADFLKHYTTEEVANIVKDKKALIIDARTPDSVRYGFIEGAINIPMYQTSSDIRKKLANVDKNKLLIVYCQSTQCPYSELVASDLHSEGFENLALYKGGWVEWQQYIARNNDKRR